MPITDTDAQKAKHLWRDIFSVNAWTKIRQQATQSDMKNAVAKNLIAVKILDDKIAAYHQMRKDKLDNFKSRMLALAEIETIAEKYLSTTPFNKTATKQTRSKLGTYQDFRTDTIDPWLYSLARRAHKKRMYLDIMRVYYKTKPGDRNTAKFRKHLVKAVATYETAKTGAQKIPISPGAELELMDPMHRGVELDLTPGAKGRIEIEANKDWPIAVAVCEWLDDTNAKNKPFFVWLENHPMCTTTPGLDDEFRDRYKHKVTRIPYGRGDLKFTLAIPDAGRLKAGPIDGDPATFQPLATDNNAMVGGLSMKMIGGAAYVWPGGDEIYTYRHIPTAVHHSTFAGGGLIECAGMWKVQNGKVTFLNNHSGHYKPGRRQIEKFKTYLESKNVLDANFDYKVIGKA
jgi:hypothetical protein